MNKVKESIVRAVEPEEGFVLVTALVMMAILSFLGMAALSTTMIELQIAGNDRQEKKIFYGTESGCRRGGQWLRNLEQEVADKYTDSDNLTAYISAQDFDKGLHIRSISESEEANIGDASYAVKYRYDVKESETTSGTRMTCRPIPGNDPSVLDCSYDVSCVTQTVSGGGRHIDIRVDKPTAFK